MKVDKKMIRDHLSCWRRRVEFGELQVVDGKHYLDGKRISKHNIRTMSIEGGFIRFAEYEDRLVVVEAYRKNKGRRRLTDEQVRGVRAARAAGESLSVVSKRFGISPQSVSQITLGYSYTEVE